MAVRVALAQGRAKEARRRLERGRDHLGGESTEKRFADLEALVSKAERE